MNILLSVIVPVYNIKNYIEKCIDSICEQSYCHLEIILVDDGSTDGSGFMCDEYAQKDARIKVVHKKNGGLVSARKAGAIVATGDYIINVDGDDWIEQDRFKNLVEKALKCEPCMVYLAGHYKDYSDTSVLIVSDKYQDVYEGEQIRNELMNILVGDNVYLERHMQLHQVLWCVRRDIYVANQLKIDENIRRSEDIVAIFSCILDSKKIMCINEPSYHYFQREGSITYQKANWNENHANIYYNQMCDIIDRHVVNSSIMRVAMQYSFHNIFMTNYKKLYMYYTEYLFPFPIVHNGSRIIVYGAGNIGVEIVNAIDTGTRHQIVAWVDKKRKENPRSTHVIEDISVIFEREYDYIVVAILLADVSLSVKYELQKRGVPENKIALMQSSVMNINDLHKIMK